MKCHIFWFYRCNMTSLKSLTLALLASVASAACRKTCVVPSSNGTESDSPAIQETFDRCSKDSTILFEKNVDYNVFEPIAALKLDNVIISVQGNLHLPQDIPTVQKIVADNGGRVEWFEFKGKNVQYIGSEDVHHPSLIILILISADHFTRRSRQDGFIATARPGGRLTLLEGLELPIDPISCA